MRLALRGAGLDPASVDPGAMQVVLRKVLPAELAKRAVADAEALCERIATRVAAVEGTAAADRIGAAARAVDRFGRA